MSVSTVLAEAADIIQARGLWQGWNDNAGTCAANAIAEASHGDAALKFLARQALLRHLGISVMTFTECQAIYRWNDERGRTKSEVVAALRGASVTAEAAAIIAATEPVEVSA